MIVDVYFNLHRKVWSVRDTKTRKVIGHYENVILQNCVFKVSEAGRQRVLKEKFKNIHAFVRGSLRQDLLSSDSFDPLRAARLVGYNPYKVESFCEVKDIKSKELDPASPVYYGKLVTLISVGRQVWVRH